MIKASVYSRHTDLAPLRFVFREAGFIFFPLDFSPAGRILYYATRAVSNSRQSANREYVTDKSQAAKISVFNIRPAACYRLSQAKLPGQSLYLGGSCLCAAQTHQHKIYFAVFLHCRAQAIAFKGLP